ncbi:FecR family protein [Dyadobacter soli]|uniref:FecR family protein n=1 Tax=Dyadobacter soli TaxID=659014 RepID=A0A1G7G9F9_9BACT|nr:FecR family protein [Dyadobacter soli]SDE84778.1 FecR family protein [Dyadobacter soli]
MQRESYTTVTQFCDDALFREWVITGRDNAEWVQWLEANADKQRLVQEARYLILAIGDDAARATTGETEQALEETWWRIHEQERRVPPGGGRSDRDRPTAIRSLTTWWRVAAAVLVFAMGLGWYLSRQHFGQTEVAMQKPALPAGRDIEVFNDSKVARLVNLEDGSTIILQPNGKLSYPVKFEAERREVHLSGEAFFEVSKNRKRPFLVYTNDIVTEVVGTSFRIKAADDQPEVEVFVKTGEVHVRQIQAKDAAENVVLLPNQSVSYVKSRSLFEKPENKDIPKRAIEYLNFDFSDAPVGTIFSTLENAYGVTIEYPHDALRDCYLSTSLSDEPLLSKLKIVCESISSGTQFRMEGNHVIVESTGCN